MILLAMNKSIMQKEGVLILPGFSQKISAKKF